MQRILFEVCFLSLVLSFAYCSKENGRTQTTAAQLQGTWELRQAQSGMVPTLTYPTGNGNRFYFTNTTFERYANDTLAANGTYYVVKDTTVEQVGLIVEPGEFTNRIVFESNPYAQKTFFQIIGNQLKLLSGYFPTDGGSREVYEKVKDIAKPE